MTYDSGGRCARSLPPGPRQKPPRQSRERERDLEKHRRYAKDEPGCKDACRRRDEHEELPALKRLRSDRTERQHQPGILDATKTQKIDRSEKEQTINVQKSMTAPPNCLEEKDEFGITKEMMAPRHVEDEEREHKRRIKVYRQIHAIYTLHRPEQLLKWYDLCHRYHYCIDAWLCALMEKYHFIAPLPPIPDLLPLPGLVQEPSREPIKAASGEMTTMASAVASREKTFAVEKAAGHSKEKTDKEEHVGTERFPAKHQAAPTKEITRTGCAKSAQKSLHAKVQERSAASVSPRPRERSSIPDEVGCHTYAGSDCSSSACDKLTHNFRPRPSSISRSRRPAPSVAPHSVGGKSINDVSMHAAATDGAIAKSLQSWLAKQGGVASSSFQVTSITEVTSTTSVDQEVGRQSSHLQTKNLLKILPSSSSNSEWTLQPSQCRVCGRHGHWGNECPRR